MRFLALQCRCPDAGLLHHSDQGCTYTAEDFQRVLEQHGIVCSMSRRGECYDNAAMHDQPVDVASPLLEP